MDIWFLLSVCCISAVASFGGSEDKFIKKYAMMKIYESCFGSDVVKQIRKEMKVAVTKCTTIEMPPSTTPATIPEDPQHDHQPPSSAPGPNSVFPNNQPPIDIEKLHQAILAYRPNNINQPALRPAQGFSAIPPSSFYSPMAYGNTGFQGGFPFYYPGYQQVPFSPYSPLPIIGQQFYGSNRMSRDMGIKGQIEILASSMSNRVKNVTCIMQELGYLDENLEPNFNRITERIGNLPVDEELKHDMQDGLHFCQQFSQCVPEIKKEKSPLSRELIRPMFFFKCYKHKKLEACIMKDVRDKYAGVSDDELDADMELRRQSKSTKLPSDKEKEIEDLTASMYEFLYASDGGFDIDGIV
ncbi:uncharacterized protein LOC132696847 isoform X2 [Cylas formicarius]|nr:uncharacterized protein LOC132696847 isoform X2 [Cylas formicarius]